MYVLCLCDFTCTMPIPDFRNRKYQRRQLLQGQRQGTRTIMIMIHPGIEALYMHTCRVYVCRRSYSTYAATHVLGTSLSMHHSTLNTNTNTIVVIMQLITAYQLWLKTTRNLLAWTHSRHRHVLPPLFSYQRADSAWFNGPRKACLVFETAGTCTTYIIEMHDSSRHVVALIYARWFIHSFIRLPFFRAFCVFWGYLRCSGVSWHLHQCTLFSFLFCFVLFCSFLRSWPFMHMFEKRVWSFEASKWLHEWSLRCARSHFLYSSNLMNPRNQTWLSSINHVEANPRRDKSECVFISFRCGLFPSFIGGWHTLTLCVMMIIIIIKASSYSHMALFQPGCSKYGTLEKPVSRQPGSIQAHRH